MRASLCAEISPDARLLAIEDADQLESAMGRLTTEEKMLVRLSVLESWEVAMLARALNKAEELVHQDLNLALARLRRHLQTWEELRKA